MVTWHDILGDLNPEASGELDWPTGIVMLNCDIDELQTIIPKIGLDQNERSLHERDLLETISHETIHYMQICMSGFLYSFAVDLFEAIRKCVPKKGFKNLKEMFDIIENQPAEVSEIQNTFGSKMNDEGEEGLTVRSIVESAALLIQKRMHSHDLSPHKYLEMLDHLDLDQEYRSAYDVVLKYLGESAFISYPFLSYISLCTDNPTEALVYLCKRSKGHSIYTNNGLNPAPFVDLLKRSSLNIIGSSTDVARHKNIQHPIYFETINNLNELIEKKKLNILQYIVFPHLLPDIFVQFLVRPMLLKKKDGKYYTYMPEFFWTGMSYKERMNKFEVLLLLFAASKRILGTFEPS